MNNAVLDQVKEIASDLFNVPAQQLGPDSSPDTVPDWDSVQHLNLVLTLEQKFNVQFAPEDIEQMRTLSAIADLVGKRIS